MGTDKAMYGIGTQGALISISPAAILMRPPNLKIVVAFAFDEHGYLQSATRGERVETYTYANESPGVLGAAYNLTAVTDANGHTTGYSYYQDGELPSSVTVFIKALKPYDVVKTVSYL